MAQQLSANRRRVKEFYESGAGEALRMLREVLVGADVESIKVDGSGRSLTNKEKTLLRDIQKDGKKIALIGNKMINRRIKLLQGKLSRSRYKRKKQTFRK